MSILIKGMEMPKNCFDCPLFDDVYTDADGDDDYCCGLGVPLDYYKTSGETKKDCPLVPIAEPHGRLIDASEKIQVQMYDDMTEDYFSAEMTIDDLLSHKDWVEADVPTIVPAEPEEEEMK